MKNKAK